MIQPRPADHVVLVHPHPGPKDRDVHILPLGILYVAAPLVAQGYSVSAIDQRKDNDWRTTLKGLVTRPGTVCVGISTMTGPQIAHGLDMARVVREAAPDLPIVWGGVHPSLLPEQTAAHPLVDIACFGEGETVFPPLVEALARGRDWKDLPGLAYKGDDGKVRYFEGTPIPTSVVPLALLLIAFRAGSLYPIEIAGLRFHLVSLLFVVSGSLMISKTLRIPKP